jgi:hypothetical protein
MSNVVRSVVGMLLLAGLSVFSDAQAPQCTLGSPGSGTSVYSLSASSGTPTPQNPSDSYVFKNDRALLVRLTE